MLLLFINATIEVRLCKILEFLNFFINKRGNLLADIVLSNIVKVSIQFPSELLGVKRINVTGEITWCIQI